MSSLALVGPAGAGKSTFMGELLYAVGYISERHKEQMRAESPGYGRDSCSWASFVSDWTDLERRLGHSVEPTCGRLILPRGTELELWDTPGLPHYSHVRHDRDKGVVLEVRESRRWRALYRNFHRGLFAANEALLVAPADASPAAWEADLRWRCLACVALGRPPVGAVVTRMDQPTADFRRTCLAVARVLASCGIFVPQLWPWAPENHHLYPAQFKAAVRAFVLANRFGHVLPRLPIEVVWIIIGHLPAAEQQDSDFAFIQYGRGGFSGHEDHARQASALTRCVKELASITKRQRDRLSGHTKELAIRKELLFPVFQTHKIRGIGTVLTGRLCQGTLRVRDTVAMTGVFEHAERGQVFSVERHHMQFEEACPCEYSAFGAKNLPGLTNATRRRSGVVGPSRSVTSFRACVRLYGGRNVEIGYQTLVYNGFSRYLCRVLTFEAAGKEVLVDFLVLTKGAYLAEGDSELALIIAYRGHGEPAFSGRVVETTAEASPDRPLCG